MCGPRLVLCQFKNKSWRNYEPHFFIAVFFLSACSDHSKNTSANENSSNAQIETSKIQSNESSELSEIPLGEALDFIKSRLSRRVVGKEMWVPSDVSLAKDSWTWSESTYLTTGDDGLDASFGPTVTKELYSVKTAELSYPARVEEDKVTIECRQSKCFSIVLNVRDGESSIYRAGEARSFNVWHFRSSDEANRVAVAINHALRLSGATESKF